MSQAASSAAPLQTRVAPPLQRGFALTQPPGLRAFLWHGLYRLLFRTSPTLLNGWRIAMLRAFGARVGRGVHVARNAAIHQPWNLTIGDNVRIAHRAIVNCMAPIDLGEGVHVSQHAHLCTATHDYERVDVPMISRPITVGRYAWIAADAFVGPGVTIGDETIVGARASVSDDLPGGVVAVGTPARVTKRREPDATAAKSAARP